MKAGLLRDRVTLQIRSKVPTGLGQLVDTWADGPTYAARVRTPSGAEVTIAGQQQAQLSHVVIIRHPGTTAAAAIIPSNRLSWGGRILGIVAVIDPDNRKRQLDIRCNEIVAPPPPTYPPAGGG